MAIVYIIPIHTHLDRTLAYVSNKHKTENENYEDVFLDLHSVLNYTVDDLKTEKQFYVSEVGLTSLETAFTEMMDTKKLYNKKDGNLGYHIIQSFAPGEGTPEMIHDLGVDFVKRAFNGYEAVVATHLNTDCLHNHIVINSVCVETGKKFNDCMESYYNLRQISDELCREYGLSVIENPKKRSRKPYDLYMAEKNGEWTKDAIIKRDIDECILKTTSERGFYIEMRKLGYSFNFERKYPTISHPKFERPRRLKTLGEGYTPQDIERRLMSKWQRYKIDIPEQDNLVQEFFEPLDEPNYREVYVSFVTVVQYVKKNPNTNRELDKYLIDEMRKLDKLIEQQNLLCHNDIETPEQLEEFKTSCISQIQECDEARNRLRKMLKAVERTGDEKEVAELKEHISILTMKMRALRKDIRICDRIQEQEPKIENKINEIMNDKERKEMSTDERFRRRSGTNREDDITGR
ncbi:MAG: relaxase/mobilization nuclease domain-containing protein [Clostridia bacterium]|nr:relaxase/mobilization nuclease domain-containing protein [Clostridia bacterium]